MVERRALILAALAVLVLAACTKQGEPFMPARPGHIDSTKVEGSEFGHWTPDKNPYYVIKSVTVPRDKTLEIDAGVLIIFTKKGLNFNVRGTLIASGRSDSLVTFRPNANRGVPAAPGDFGSLAFEAGSTGNLTWTRLVYGTVTLTAVDADLMLDRCTISNSLQDGLALTRTNVVMTDCTISNNGFNGLVLNDCDSPIHPVSITHCNIGNNKYSGILGVNSSLVARRSDIRNNGDERVPEFSAGAHFEGLPGVEPPTFRQCNINQNLPCDLRNLMPPGIVVAADSNYWGPSTTDEMTFQSNPVIPPVANKDNCGFNVRQICDGLDYPNGGGIPGVRFCHWLNTPVPNFPSSTMAPGGGASR